MGIEVGTVCVVIPMLPWSLKWLYVFALLIHTCACLLVNNLAIKMFLARKSYNFISALKVAQKRNSLCRERLANEAWRWRRFLGGEKISYDLYFMCDENQNLLKDFIIVDLSR